MFDHIGCPCVVHDDLLLQEMVPEQGPSFCRPGFCADRKSCCELGHAVFVQRSPQKPKTDVDPCEVWCSQPADVLIECCDVIKILIFWPLVFKSGSSSLAADLNSQILDCNWRRLCDLEVLEDLFDMMKGVVGILTFVCGVLSIGSRVEHGVFDFGHGLNWKLGDFGSMCLGVFLGQCKGCIAKVALEDCNLVELKSVSCENCWKNSESMKQKGNEEFSQGNFDCAIMSYTKIIEFCPANHPLYGNRALCLIVTQQYKRALADGKRAIVLKPNWPRRQNKGI
uniref:Uncharacterized protein n=1 Tax=Amazona collaria TaxID=241587 RepID=A0A8B9FN65_9PSIT